MSSEISGARRYTPPPDQVQADEAVKGNRTSRLALGASVLFSILALAVSLAGFLEQREINDDQRRVNEEARAEKMLEYAVRVSWWNSGPELHIQNRSLVPINNVMLQYKVIVLESDGKKGNPVISTYGKPLYMFVAIAPCTIITLDRDAILEYYLEPTEKRHLNSIHWVRLDFTDAHGRWAVTSGGGPEPIDPVDIVDPHLRWRTGFFQKDEDWVVEQPASDCGSG